MTYQAIIRFVYSYRMSREQIPVTPAVVRWARERAGFTIEEATEFFAKIPDWEAGHSFPTYPQLEQLAERFKVPIAVFFFPAPPVVPPIRETFRTLPDAEYSQIPRRVRFLQRKAKALQINLFELCDGVNPARRVITRDLPVPAGRGVQAMARQVREYIGISTEEQSRWADADAALKRWRQALLDVGIFVFKDAFQADEYSGFCLYDENFPIIYANNSSSKTRQIFTLFHELAHLLFHTSGIDTREDEYISRLPNAFRRIEILCNQFAAEFLVPENEFDLAISGLEISEASAETLAERFHVSRELIYRRFLDRHLITTAEYINAAARWAQQRQPGGGGNVYWNKISYLGRDYIALAFRRFRQNRIDENQLAEYLDTKPKNLSTLEDYFSKSAA